MNLKKFSFAWIGELFNNRIFLICFSVLSAFICWTVVVFAVDTDRERPIANVPITVNTTALYQSYGLELVGKEIPTVTVTVSGARNEIGSLSASDFVVTPSLSSVTAPGTYDLRLNASKTNNYASYTITSVSPSTVTLSFDLTDSVRFPVTVSADGISAANGYILGNPSANPAEVMVSGPESELSRIASVEAITDRSGQMTETLNTECNLILLDEQGNQLPTDNLILSTETVEVTVPVLKRATLPLSIDFLNVPEGFDTASLEYTMSVTEIEIAGPAGSIDNLSPKRIGFIDLTGFELGASYTFDIELTQGFVNLSDHTTVTVSFGDTLSSRKISVRELHFDNAPTNYTFAFETQSIPDVVIIGPEEDLERMLSSSVVGVVDLSAISVHRGEFTVPVSIEIPEYDNVWAAGQYTVLISVRAGS